MSAFIVRNVLPVVTSVIATLFLATAVPHDLVPEAADASVASADLQRCAADGRDADACLDEADGKALVETADWLARSDAVARRASQ